MREEIDNILWKEEGIISRMRDGDYEVSEEENDIIRKFAKEVNKGIKEKKFAIEDVLLLVMLIHFFSDYAYYSSGEDAQNLIILASSIYNILVDGINFEWI